MKLLIRLTYVTIALLFISYLALPNSEFPDPPRGAVQSLEPADSETPLRRAYFTDLSRSEVISHYQSEFVTDIFGNKLANYRLNYPPEEAYGLIRDQTRSTYLEEVIYPLRESVFVNGFEPSSAKDEIIIEGVRYNQKITVRHYPSNRASRVIVGIVVSIIFYVVLSVYIKEIIQLSKLIKHKIWQ